MGVSSRNIGVIFNNGLANVRLWAPEVDEASIVISGTDLVMKLEREEFGYWSLHTDRLCEGMRYHFEVLKHGERLQRADPASLSQPEGVHGTSMIFNPSTYAFGDSNWKGQSLEHYIIYELHVGTFTPEGTFASIIEKLDHLLELGITAIELMPVASFPGYRNWGYDGVFLFAVQESYGGPLGLQKLVDACHQKGIAVILDVVYNHFGPEGNYLSDFAPYFTDKYKTPWGKAINFDDAFSDGVRQFYIENVLLWFRDFHIDALRLDAVHAIKDLSAKHILSEIAEQVELLNTSLHKKHHLIIECDLNDPKYITPLAEHGYGMDAQWTDEFHHALRVAAGQKREGYYADFNGIDHLAKAYCDAYVYDGIYSEERQKTFGSSAAHNKGEQFIVFSQNHDQVGNRMLGERTAQLHSFAMQKLLVGAVIVSPFLPLLFMGEEYGETNPFLYFVSHSDPALIKAVRKGRAKEFQAFHGGKEAPDPQNEQTFGASKLQWDLLDREKHQHLFAFYKEVISLRKSILPLKKLERKHLKVESFATQNCLVLHRWYDNQKIVCLLNFSTETQSIPFADLPHWKKILDSNAPQFGGEQESIFNADQEILLLQAETILVFTKYDV